MSQLEVFMSISYRWYFILFIIWPRPLSLPDDSAISTSSPKTWKYFFNSSFLSFFWVSFSRFSFNVKKEQCLFLFISFLLSVNLFYALLLLYFILLPSGANLFPFMVDYVKWSEQYIRPLRASTHYDNMERQMTIFYFLALKSLRLVRGRPSLSPSTMESSTLSIRYNKKYKWIKQMDKIK